MGLSPVRLKTSLFLRCTYYSAQWLNIGVAFSLLLASASLLALYTSSDAQLETHHQPCASRSLQSSSLPAHRPKGLKHQLQTDSNHYESIFICQSCFIWCPERFPFPHSTKLHSTNPFKTIFPISQHRWSYSSLPRKRVLSVTHTSKHISQSLSCSLPLCS